jgi:hypothetical protein
MTKFPLSAEVIEDGIKNGFEDIVADYYEELYEYYLNSGEMPYGVAKARTGDPDQWIYDQLEARNF